MKKFLLLCTAVLGLSACSVGPDYNKTENTFSDTWSAKPSPHISANPADMQWWKNFQDPLLESYIHQAITHNKDVKISLANLRKARALRREESASFLPSFEGNAAANRSGASDALSTTGKGDVRGFYDAGFDASWEMDLFGGNRRSVEAADARIQSAVADYQDILRATLSEVARNYYEARGQQKRIAITKQNAALFQQTMDLIKARKKAGEASAFDLSRARGQFQLTHARIPNLEADLYAAIFKLSVLLGQPPEALLEEMKKVKPLPTPPDIVPVGLRSDILKRRPDIRRAEHLLHAAVADIGVETAALFPSFFITGDIGSQARRFGELFTASGGVWSFGGLFQWSIFEGGAIRARIKGAEAERDALLATYEKTILNALADAETALNRYGQELETRKRLEAAVKSRRRSVQLARELFDAGEEDYLAVLDAERELTTSEDSLVVSETESITKLVSLYTALGGWIKDETPQK